MEVFVCEVEDFIVHKLEKAKEDNEAKIELGETPLRVNKSAQRLIDAINEKYIKLAGKSFGTFEPDTINYPTQTFIQDYLISNISFYDLSKKLMDRLAFCAEGENFATGGYVLISKFKIDESYFFLVSMITDVLGTAITAEFDVEDSVYIDLSQLKVVGRVNLTAWNKGEQKYISFLRGKSDVAGYFKKFIGCNDVHKVNEESKKLVSVIKTFVANLSGKTDLERETIIDLAHTYLKNLNKEQKILSLEDLAKHIYPEGSDLLMEELGSEEHKILDGFIPDRRSLNGLLKIEGKSRYWSLKFDRAAIKYNDLKYDRKKRVITLQKVSEDLHKELLEALGDEDDDE